MVTAHYQVAGGTEDSCGDLVFYRVNENAVIVEMSLILTVRNTLNGNSQMNVLAVLTVIVEGNGGTQIVLRFFAVKLGITVLSD